MFWRSSVYVEKATNFLKKTDVNFYGMWVDCGSGHGHYSVALKNLGADSVISIDKDYRKLKGMIRSFKGRKIFSCLGDCKKIPVRNDTADGSLMVNVLHYYKNPQDFIEEASRILKFNGKIVVIEYKQSHASPWNPHPLNSEMIEKLLKFSGFEIEKSMLVDRSYRPKHLTVGKLIGKR